MAGWTPLVHEGPLAARFKTEHGGKRTTLVKETTQPERDLILGSIAEERKAASLGDGPKDLQHGRYLGSIPLLDFMNLQESHPDLFSPDAEIARKATIKFWNSSEAELFRVQRA
jgi:hypothetical protein